MTLVRVRGQSTPGAGAGAIAPHSRIDEPLPAHHAEKGSAAARSKITNKKEGKRFIADSFG